MEKIRLSKSEKEVFRLVANFRGKRPATYPAHTFNQAAHSLYQKGLIVAKFYTNGEVCTIYLTDMGKQYLSENPNLRNPVDWTKVSAITAIVSLLVSLIIALVGCSLLLSQ